MASNIIDKIVDEVSVKTDMLLDEIASNYMTTVKIHAHHSTNNTLASTLKIMMLEFLQEYKVIDKNAKDKLHAR